MRQPGTPALHPHVASNRLQLRHTTRVHQRENRHNPFQQLDFKIFNVKPVISNVIGLWYIPEQHILGLLPRNLRELLGEYFIKNKRWKNGPETSVSQVILSFYLTSGWYYHQVEDPDLTAYTGSMLSVMMTFDTSSTIFCCCCFWLLLKPKSAELLPSSSGRDKVATVKGLMMSATCQLLWQSPNIHWFKRSAALQVLMGFYVRH